VNLLVAGIDGLATAEPEPAAASEDDAGGQLHDDRIPRANT